MSFFFSGGVYSSGISGVSAVNQANVTSSTGCFIWTHEPARTHLPIPPFAKRVRSITTPLYTCSILGMGAALNCLCSKKEPKKKEITDLGGTISRDPEESEEDDHTLFRRAGRLGDLFTLWRFQVISRFSAWIYYLYFAFVFRPALGHIHCFE